ncbi:hypothetical protein JW935_11695 [candidate division KSB1 bacterium]|nr:hypothetical protein [candidate division KSB1 bacterium]
MTEKLYFSNSYLKEFKSTVVETGTLDEKPALVLDKTAFYPTSGGQMHDTGQIQGVRVVDVQLVDNKIWHVLEKPVTGTQIHAKVDWARRFDFMQQHTAFHILAQSFQQVLEIKTLSSHLGEEFSSIDIDSEKVPASDLDSVEKLANDVIWQNRSVRTYFVDGKNKGGLVLRDQPQVLSGPVRCVEIEDFDLDPCGGTHVRYTGEVGLLKILSREKVRGYERFFFVAGGRALRDFQSYYTILKDISNTLTTGFDDLCTSVQRLIDAGIEQAKTLVKLSKMLEEPLLTDIFADMKNKSVVSKLIPGFHMDALQRLARTAIKTVQGTLLLASPSPNPCLVFTTSNPGMDLRPVLKQVLPLIDGRGGGDAGFVQGGGKNAAGVEKALKEAEKLVRGE